jgi:sulfur carrier protein
VIVRVNGTEREMTEGATVGALVEDLGYGARQVVVELNGEPVERSRFAEITLSAGDTVEVVRAVAGG